MSGQGRSNFTAMGPQGPAIPFFRNGSNANGTGGGFATTRPYVRQRITVEPDNNSFGSQIVFSIDRPCDLIGGLRLQVDQAASSGDGRFGDFQLWSQIETVDFDYNNQRLQRHRGDALKSILFRTRSEKERQAEAACQNGFLSDEERNKRFLAAQTGMSCALYPDWEELGNQLPILQLPTAIKVTITLKADAQRARKYGSSALSFGAITNPKLVIEGVHLLEVDRRALFSRVGMESGGGWQIKTVQRQYVLNEPITQSVVATANTLVEHTVKLNQITNTAFNLVPKLRYQDCVDQQSTLEPDAQIPIHSFHLANQNDKVSTVYYGEVASKDGVSRGQGLYLDNAKRYPERSQGDVELAYGWAHDEMYQSQIHAGNFGAISANRYNSLVLKFTVNANFASATPFLDKAALQASAATIDKTKWYLTVEAECHQIVMCKKGDLRRYQV